MRKPSFHIISGPLILFVVILIPGIVYLQNEIYLTPMNPSANDLPKKPKLRGIRSPSSEIFYFSSDFEGSSAISFTNGSNWNWIDGIPSPSGDVPSQYYGESPTHSFFYGNPTTGEVPDDPNYGGDPTVADLSTPSIDLSSAVNPLLTFQHWYQCLYDSGGDDLYDYGQVWINDTSGIPALLTPTGGYPITDQSGYSGYAVDFGQNGVGWTNASYDLTPYIGTTVKIIFRVIATDLGFHAGGWYLDDIKVNETADVTPPVITPLNTTVTIDEGSTDILSWNVSDDEPDRYNITRDGTLVDNGTWVNGWINISLGLLPAGVFGYNLTVNDTTGNVASSSITVTVHDIITPSITGPAVMEILEENTSTTVLQWNASDNHPLWYNITMDGSLQTENPWDGSDLSYPLTTLTPGNHTFLATVEDISGNTNQSTTVVVVRSSRPYVEPVSDFTVAEGSSTNITWYTLDDTPFWYNITLDEDVIANSTWIQSYISITLSNLTLGQYNVTLWLFDSNGFNNSDLVIITVVDETSPVIEGPSGLTYEEGIANHSLSWNVTDLHPQSFTISIDGEIIIPSDQWNSTQNITVDVGGLGYGQHTLVLSVDDVGGNVKTHTAIITVLDNQLPVISQLEDIIFYEAEKQSFIWLVYDLNPSNIRIYRNSSLISNMKWENRNKSITVSIAHLPVGNYTYRIEVLDLAGNQQVGNITIQVLQKDHTLPIISGLSLVNYSQTLLPITLTWQAEDLNPSHYQIYINNTLIRNVIWNGSWIRLSQNFSIGTWNVTIQVTDIGNNSVHFTTIVIIHEPEPQSTTTPLTTQTSTTVSSSSSTSESSKNSPGFNILLILFILFTISRTLRRKKQDKK